MKTKLVVGHAVKLLTAISMAMGSTFVVQPNIEEPVYMWKTDQDAESICIDNKATIDVSFTNKEKDRSIDVIVTDLQSGKSVDLGTIAPGKTATDTILTGLQSLSNGTVRSDLTWTDGSPGSDKRFAFYDAIDCKPEPETFQFQFHIETDCQANTWLLVIDHFDGWPDRVKSTMFQVDNVVYDDPFNISGSWGNNTTIKVWIHIKWDNEQRFRYDRRHHKPDCPSATYALTVSGKCNGGLATGHADTPALLEITGTGADGQSVSISQQVGPGDFNVTIDWENPGTFGPHGISLTGTLTADHEVVADDSFDEDVTCGEPPPPPPGGFCRSFKIVKHGQTDEVRFKGDGLGVEWRVVRTSDGKVMAEGSGNHAEGSFVDHSDSSYKLQFRGEDGNWSEGCISDPTELCAACEGPQWEVMVGENSSDEDEKGGRGIVFSKGPCTICPESLTAQVDSWYYYDGYQPITMYYQGEYYDTTMHVGADGVEYNMLEIDLLGNDHNYICLRYGVRSIANLSEEDRCAREYINKYVSCSVSPGWQDTTEDGMGHFRDGQQEADWVTWLLNEGFFPRTYEGAADAYVWANELGANGTNALPERTASADSNSNVSNMLVELEQLTT